MVGDEAYSTTADGGGRRVAVFVGSLALGAIGIWFSHGTNSENAQAATVGCDGTVAKTQLASADPHHLSLPAQNPCTSPVALNAGNPNWHQAAVIASEPPRLNLRTSLQTDDVFARRTPPRERFAASVDALRTKPESDIVEIATTVGPMPDPTLLDELDRRADTLDLCGAAGSGLTSGDCDPPPVEDIDDGGERGEHDEDGGEGGERGEDDHADDDHGGEGGEHGDDIADNDGHGGEHVDGGGDRDCDNSGGERGGDDGHHGGEGGEGGERGGGHG